jgi:DNA modification methylase
MHCQVIQGDCAAYLAQSDALFDLTFLDPPFNQGKEYAYHEDDQPSEAYWAWMSDICRKIFERTRQGGALYFMQREKNAESTLRCLRESGWTLQNLIIWKKKTSAVPSAQRYGKGYQIIAFATKGHKPRLFHRLRIDPPLPPNYRYKRKQGMYVTDIWDDIRELTSGYFAGDEAIRTAQGERFHKQQSPLELLVRIILTSSQPDDLVFDPFAGTGTTLVAAAQLRRRAIGVEIDPENVRCIESRLASPRPADSVERFYAKYACTPDLDRLWAREKTSETPLTP